MHSVTDTSSDDDIGPALPTSASPAKKKRKLPYEKLYISALPASQRYHKSLMHKDQLSFIKFTPITDFLITGSIDGVVKFWKKTSDGIEFVKEFMAHGAEIVSVAVSQDGRSLATAGTDKTIKIFDVASYGAYRFTYPKLQADHPRSLSYVRVRKRTEVDMLGTWKSSDFAVASSS